MPGPMISIDYAHTLTSTVGTVHGLTLDELKRGEAEVAALVKRVEAERAAGSAHRYRDLPGDKAMLKGVLAAAKKYARGCENLVVLGIGGSALGNIAIQSALNKPFYNLLPPAKRKGPRLFVMDNVDPVQFQALLDVIGPSLKKTIFNVISKSGETAETAAQFQIVRDLLRNKLGKSFNKQILLTTDPETGTLREQALADGYDMLPVPPGVGGRFSVLSAVGLLSGAICGVNIAKLLDGAKQMSTRCGDTNVRKNPAAMLALLLHAFYTRGKRMHVMMPYSNQLKDFADWYCQLWAESLGKNKDLAGKPAIVGPTPIRALGATDQHSQVQLYREGPADKVFIFLEVEKFDCDVKIPKADKGTPEASRYLGGASLGKLLSAEKRATEYALVASQRPCITIRFPKIAPETIGQFIMLWEAATTLAGGLLNINPYDQPAVQLGKDFTYGLMGKKGYEAQAKEYAAFAKKSGSFEV
ncbi:MAG: glucose-6-phosphate isomerase [Phycisphaerae bacterium]